MTKFVKLATSFQGHISKNVRCKYADRLVHTWGLTRLKFLNIKKVLITAKNFLLEFYC